MTIFTGHNFTTGRICDISRLILLLTLPLLIIKPAEAGEKSKTQILSPEQSYFLWVKHYQQGYNMKIWLDNALSMGIEAEPFSVINSGCSSGIGLEYPAGSCVEHLYAATVWIGGIIDGSPRVSTGFSENSGTREFLPERRDTLRDRFWRTHTGRESFDTMGYSGYYEIHGIQVNRRGCDDDGDGKIDEDELDGQDNDGDWNPLTDDIGADGLPDSLEVGCDGKRYDPVTNPDPAYDNFDPNGLDRCHLDAHGNYMMKNDKNGYTEKNGMPDHGEPHVDEDYGAYSDNDIYYGVTDTSTSYTAPGHIPMGIKTFVKSYAWKEDYAGFMLPFDFYFVNVGKNTISDVFIALFCDMDVGPISVPGYYRDNYMCTFGDLRTVYTGNGVDRGSTPMALTLLGASRPFDSLIYVLHGSEYYNPFQNDTTMYYAMTGTYPRPSYPPPCQSPSAPTDTKFLISVGPFGTMNPGDTIKMTAAFVGGEAVQGGPDNLYDNVKKAIVFYHRGFRPPTLLPSPPLKIRQHDTQVRISWGPQVDSTKPDPARVWDDSNILAERYPDSSWRRNNPPCGTITFPCGGGGHVCLFDSSGHPYLPGGNILGGFRLYRSEDQAGTPAPESWTLVRQYTVAEGKSAYGTGLDTMYIDSNLTRDKRYWYSVTSVSIPGATILPLRTITGELVYDTVYGAPTESPISENQTLVKTPFSASEKLNQVLVVPNPVRIDRDYETGTYGFEHPANTIPGSNRMIKFIHLPAQCTIRIITMGGELLATLQHNDPASGEMNWSLFNEAGHPLASGVYIFTVESRYGRQTGKFVIIR